MTTDLIASLRKPGDEVLSTRKKCHIADLIERQAALIEMMAKALSTVEQFINRHSEDWYMSGQRDLTEVCEALAAYETWRTGK